MICKVIDNDGKVVKDFFSNNINEDEILRNYPIGYKVEVLR